MNYTHRMRLDSIASKFRDADSASIESMGSLLYSESKSLRLKLAKYVDGDKSWPATLSERAYLKSLEELCLISKMDEPSRGERIDSFREGLKSSSSIINIVFFVQEYSLWASFRSVYDYLSTRSDCRLKLVYVYAANVVSKDETDDNIMQYRQAGYPIINMVDYDLAVDSPDIVFYLKPYKESNGTPTKLYIEEVSNHVEYSVFISYCLDVQGGKQLHRFFYAMPMFYYAWRVIAYSPHYESELKRFSYKDASNIVAFGHPKFDGIAEIISNSSQYRLPEWDEMIAGRPVIMWNTHFSTKPGTGVGTFLQHWRKVFDFFSSHQDYVLLWRPHPYFWGVFDRDGGYGMGGSKGVREMFERLPNVIVDDHGDYRHAFCTADALVSDATTFMVEFGMTGKPVMYTPKEDGESVIESAYLPGVQICSGDDDFLDYLMTAGKRPSSCEAGFFEREFGACDGHNGERIGSYIIEEMQSSLRDYGNVFFAKCSEGE